MFKPFNNKTLVIVLAALLGIFLLVKFLNAGKSERNFRTDLVQIDTTAMQTILLYPKSGQQEEIRFTRTGKQWTVEKGGIRAAADPRSLESLIAAIVQLKPQRPVARSKEKWAEYQLTDSLATRVKVLEGKKTTLDLLVGKISFQQRNSPQQMQVQQQPNISGTSYVRLAGETEVYAVEGFLSMSFDQDFANWRDKELATLRRDDLTRLSFSYPADSGFVLAKTGSDWALDGSPVDSVGVQRYLNALSSLSSRQFADDFAGAAPTHQLVIEGNNMSALTIKGVTGSGEGDFYLNSSLKPEVWFQDKALFERIFVGKGTFGTD